MPSQISIQDARDNFADMVTQTAIIGKQFVITKFGRPSAMLVPVKQWEDKKRWTGLDAAYGLWKDRKDIKDANKWVENLRTKMSLRTRE